MKRVFTLIFVLSVLLGIIHIDVFAAGNGPEAQYEKGMDYFEIDDFDSAFSYFQISGEVKGYAPSQNMLGVCYRDGLGTERDLAEAERYFKLSADQGYAPAQENLKTMEKPVIRPSVHSDIAQYSIKNSVLTISGAVEVNPASYIEDWDVRKKSIKKVIIEKGAKEIAWSAFSDCDSLEEVELPVGLERISGFAFNSCELMKSIVIPDGVKLIDEMAFDYCKNLKSIELPESLTTIGNYAFSFCSALKQIVLPSYLEQIGKEAFSACGLTEIALPDSLTTIGDGIFAGCSDLKNVMITPSHPVLELKNGALLGRADNKLIYVPVSSTGKYIIPDGIRSIGRKAFYKCEKLTQIVIPYGVTVVDNSAFEYCKGLTEITIPDSVESIEGNAFSVCVQLSDIIIPGSVKTIGDSAFSQCKALSDVTILDGVESIGKRAFSWCEQLVDIRIPNSVQTIGDDIFSDCSSDMVVSVGHGSYAEKYCQNKKLNYRYFNSQPDADTLQQTNGSVQSAPDVEIKNINLYTGANSILAYLSVRENNPIVLTAEAIEKTTREPVPGIKFVWESADSSCLKVTANTNGTQCTLEALKPNAKGVTLKVSCAGYEQEQTIYLFEDLNTDYSGINTDSAISFASPDLEKAICEYVRKSPGSALRSSDVQGVFSVRILQNEILINDQYYGTSTGDVMKSAYEGPQCPFGEKWPVFDMSDLLLLPHLGYLEIAGCTLIHSAALAHCSNLQRLDIAFCTGVDVDAATRCTSLTELKINCCHGIIIENVAKASRIEGLQFTGCDYDFFNGFDNLLVLANLRYLGLMISFKNGDRTISHKTSLNFLQNFNQITSLIIGDGLYIKEIGGLENMTRLEELNLSNAGALMVLNGAAPPDYNVLRRMTGMKILDLHGAAGLEDLSFTEEMRNLTALDIHNTDIKDLSPLLGKPLEKLTVSGYLYDTAKSMFPNTTINVA